MALGIIVGFEEVPDLEEIACKEGLREGLIVYLNALADGPEVWRGVEAYFPGSEIRMRWLLNLLLI